MVIDLQEFEKTLEYISTINSAKLESLEIHDNGQLIVLSSEDLEELKFTGLTNFMILSYRLWENKSL